jgi:hypothetical protein
VAAYVVVAVRQPPALGTATHGVIYGGDHVTAEDAIAAAVALLNPTSVVKMWAVLASAFTNAQVDVTNTPTIVPE